MLRQSGLSGENGAIEFGSMNSNYMQSQKTKYRDDGQQFYAVSCCWFFLFFLFGYRVPFECILDRSHCI
jgi:hypothetical protein